MSLELRILTGLDQLQLYLLNPLERFPVTGASTASNSSLTTARYFFLMEASCSMVSQLPGTGYLHSRKNG